MRLAMTEIDLESALAVSKKMPDGDGLIFALRLGDQRRWRLRHSSVILLQCDHGKPGTQEIRRDYPP
jgi:hypothetical protein